MNLDKFLSAFYSDQDEPICFRAFKPKDAPETENNIAKNLTFTRRQLTEDNSQLVLRKLNHLRGIYFAVNSGGHTDKEITRFNGFFVEDDKTSIEDQHRALDECPVQPSIRVETKRSVHAYWLLTESCTEEEWRNLQKRIIYYFGWDDANTNPARLMRLPFFLHLTYNEDATGNYEYKPVEVVKFNPEKKYSIGELQAVFPVIEPTIKNSDYNSEIAQEIKNGTRNKTLFSIAGSLRRNGFNENEIFAAIAEINLNRANPPLGEIEVRNIAKSVMRYKPDVNTTYQPDNQNQQGTEFDEQSLAIPNLSEIALYGLAGEVVRTIEPHTEADNAALLIQFLAGFGSLIGKSAHFRAEADCHYTKLFAVIVGASSKGRKGTSWGQIRRLLCQIDETFTECIQDGLSSGEGLIFHVRAPQSKKVPVREKGKIIDYQDEIIDEGAKEKRAFVVEPEFARVLRTMHREGNILSSVIRQAWDSDRLRVMTKNPLKASETHISIIGHITKDELQRNLDETETANGFANRFLWVFTCRSKYLPEGGSLQDSQLNPLVERLNKTVINARFAGEIRRDPKARELWIQIYPKLSDGHTGMLGAVTSRAEAQVMRLAIIYALLDMEELIRVEHLKAALALWQYCEDSAAYIFGSQTGSKTADTIYSALLGAAEEGMTKTQIRDLFKRNADANQTNSALKLLIELGRIEFFKRETKGRNCEIYRAKVYDKNDKNDKKPDYD